MESDTNALLVQLIQKLDKLLQIQGSAISKSAYTFEEVQERLQCSLSQVHTLLRKGVLKRTAIRTGKRVQITAESVEEALKAPEATKSPKSIVATKKTPTVRKASGFNLEAELAKLKATRKTG